MEKQKRKMAGKTREPRLTRREWLGRALDAIARDGRGWIGIHDLVEHVGVTKGSFYWHFKDRADFVKALLDYYVEFSTGSVARDLADGVLPPEQRLLELAVRIVNDGLDRYNLAIQAWGLREPAAAAVVRKVERFRRDYVRGLFREMGFRGEALAMRTQTFYVYYTFEAASRPRVSKQERMREIKLRHRMLVAR